MDRPVLSGIESVLEVQQRIGIDRQSVGVVGIIMARRPFDIGTGIEAARMLVEQFGAQIMLRHAGDTIVAVARVIVEEEITVGIGGRSEERREGKERVSKSRSWW